jgi:hypothetical protein
MIARSTRNQTQRNVPFGHVPLIKTETASDQLALRGQNLHELRGVNRTSGFGIPQETSAADTAHRMMLQCAMHMLETMPLDPPL